MPLFDASGQAIPASEVKRVKLQALVGSGMGNTAYEAADWDTADMGTWNPWLGSPDNEINPYRNRIVARIRDLTRNDGWAAGAVTTLLDAAIGADFRLIARPDWRGLQAHAAYNGRSFDAVWSDEFGRQAEALWRAWAYDPARWCDASRRLTVPQIFRLAFRHKLVDGEALAVLPWLPERMGAGRANYATTIQGVDPDRLSNPANMFDQRMLRGGVEIDAYGAPVAYHIRRAHQGDWFNAADSLIWDRVPRETEFGRPVVIHDFDADRFGQHRAPGGIFAPVLGRMRMLGKYDQVELQAAVINAIFAAYVESPYDPALVQDGLSDESSELPAYQQLRDSVHGAQKLTVGGARLAMLAPGEKIQSVTAARPAVAFEAFQNAVLRNVAAAAGMSAEQLSKDWSKSNYSSARGALLEAWKTLSRRRDDFATGFANPIYGAFLEEAMDRGELPLPAGAPDFIEARGAYAACRWMGPPRGWIDPVKEASAAVLRMDAGLTTLQQECADQGLDYEEVVAQRAREIKLFKENDMPPPVWYGMPAHLADNPPQAQ